MHSRKRANTPPTGADDLAILAGPVEPQGPPQRRAIVNDAMIEKLGYILADNERGVLAVFDV